MSGTPAGPPRSAAIERVTPQVGGGAHPVKRIVGDEIIVEADVFADGHDEVSARLRWRPDRAPWRETRMEPIGNDRWRASFRPEALGGYRFTVRAAVGAGQATHPEVELWAERERARSGAWYELFPRSASAAPGRHGTLDDVRARLPYVAGMGFDVLYLPPIHPIGVTGRKGPDDSLVSGPGDPGVPWAIGSPDGGHTAVHPELGTLGDFDRLLAAAGAAGLEIAMDLAYQCSPDHPWVREHPSWFRRAADGTIPHAENPPKHYQDIYHLDFETGEWRALWDELRAVLDFWIDRGVRIFRVDNPHTKPFAFWEWLIRESRRAHPDLIFLAEAFTRPTVMHRLAKVGFTQSYTYFTWRDTKDELERYFGHDLPAAADYLRPSLWPNTPDILPPGLQRGGRPAFVARLVLAATLGATYGIYGPTFELMEREPREPGSEEYRASEKYEIRHWDLGRPGSLAPLIAAVNGIRRAHPALRSGDPPRFHPVDDPRMLAYSRGADDATVVCVVNLDPSRPRTGAVDLSALPGGAPEKLHDLLGGARHAPASLTLDPASAPAIVAVPER